MKVAPYISFEGRAEEALGYYAQAIGAQVKFMMRVKDAPEPTGMPPGNDDKLLHAEMQVGDATVMCSDGFCTGKPTFGGIHLAYTAADDAEARRVFDALADGGQASMPLAKTFFASSFGMLEDRFGVPWMVVTAA